MSQRPSTYAHVYDASKRKTFRRSLCHLLQSEFPGVFGPTVTPLFADKVDALYEQFNPPRAGPYGSGLLGCRCRR
jgi:hypothetical protein